MKRNFTLLVSAWILIASAVKAQTGDNFNSRTGVPVSNVISHLQDQCWIFKNFGMNNGTINNIEGDGTVISGTSINQPTQIYTPVMSVYGSIEVQFKYRVNAVTGNGVRRWIKVYLTYADGTMVGNVLDSIELTNINTNKVYPYKKTFTVGSGPYKLCISLGGINGNVRVGFDELYASAPLYYPHSCNEAPVAKSDLFAGGPNRQVSGKVTTNDYDPNGEGFSAYLVSNSPDGNVVLNEDGTFTFTPNAGFKGTVTTFTYRICDFGYPSQCSVEVPVILTFPENSSTLPVGLVDFKGLYKNNGYVELTWGTSFEQNSAYFEVQRSTDGATWTTTGTVKAAGNSTANLAYSFIDNPGRNTANRNDLYYRLKQVDIDGKSVLSRTLIVRVYNTQTLKMVSVTPNPAKNDIGVTVQLNEPAVITMRVFNIQGIEAVRKTVKGVVNSNSFTLEGTSKLTPGMYMLEVTINSKERMLVKLIKE